MFTILQKQYKKQGFFLQSISIFIGNLSNLRDICFDL